MSDPAEQLVEQAKAGSMAAASELVGLYYERIYAYLRRASGHDEDAADLTQKTFMRLWSALPSYAAKSSFSTWLHGIAHHVYLDWRRQNNFNSPQSEEWWSTRAAPMASPYEDAVQRDTARRLFSLVETLDEDVRQTVHLHYYQGLSIAETAEVLRVATSTVKYRLQKALETLRPRAVHDLPHHHQTIHRAN